MGVTAAAEVAATWVAAVVTPVAVATLVVAEAM